MNGVYGQILDESLLDGCRRRADPAALTFFRAPHVDERPGRAEGFDLWVSSPLPDAATDEEIRAAANEVAAELIRTPTRLMHDLLVGENSLMPASPKWSDLAPLSDTVNRLNGRHRFNVVGGNCLTETGDVSRDLKRAYARLLMVNAQRPFARSERLRVYCSADRVGCFERASESVRFEFAVVAQPDLAACDPWLLTRSKPIAAIRVGKPACSPPGCVHGVMFGARFDVWLDDPMSTVRIDPVPGTHA